MIRRITGISGEAARYIIAGSLTTLLNFSVLALMSKVLKIAVTPSNVTAVSVSVLFAYVINKRYVFKKRCTSKSELALEFLKFVGSRGFTMALDVGVVLLFTEVLYQDELLGKLASLVLVVVANFVISKAIVFRKEAGGGL